MCLCDRAMREVCKPLLALCLPATIVAALQLAPAFVSEVLKAMLAPSAVRPCCSSCHCLERCRTSSLERLLLLC
jgi:hypothetical protein